MDRDNLKYTNVVLERIAAALEETLRLVKQDQEEAKKRWEKESEQTTRASNGPSIPAALEMAPGSRTKLQAATASCKRQAASLTRLNYNVIVSYKLREKKV